VLRWRHHKKAQASEEAEGRQERMRQFGKVDIPHEAFIAALKVDS
jgi:translation elongation factor EF-4